MAVLEGAWDCSQCNTIGIAGRLTDCPHCGDSRNPLLDPEERPYLPTNAREVTDREGLELADSGPNWNCGSCGVANLATASTCDECGEPRDSNDDVAGVYTYVSGKDAIGVALSTPEQIETDRTDTVLRSADKLQALEDGPVVMPSRTLSSDALPRHGITARLEKVGNSVITSFHLGERQVLYKVGAAIVAVLMLLGGVTFAYNTFIKTHEVDLTVKQLAWERQVEVEEYRTLTLDDWSVPSDGRIQSSRPAIHHYNKVFDHKERRVRKVPERKLTGSHQEKYACGSTTVDRGNGFFENKTTYCSRTVNDYKTVYRDEPYFVDIYRDEPVYRTKYIYQVDRWVTNYFDRANEGTSPYWPIPENLGKKQRVGDERHQSYIVHLVDEEGRKHERKLDEITWSHLSPGEVVSGQQTRSGSVRDVEWPTS